MQRARRLALVALLPVLGVLVLAGCRSEPGVAAYVGSTKYTIKQVDALAAEGKNLGGTTGGFRQFALGLLVVRDVGQAEADRRGLRLEKDDPAAVAAQLGLEPGSRLAQLLVDVQAVQNGFGSGVSPVEPTAAEQREIFDHLTINNAPVSGSFADVKPALTKETIGRALALRSMLVDMLNKAGVTVNPRYAPLSFPITFRIQQASAVVAVPLSGVKTSPVTEASGAA